MKNIQLAIDGIAEDKEFNEELGLESKELKRVKLANFIKYQLGTNKIGFAKMFNISPATVTKWLYSCTEPSIEAIKRIARHSGNSIEEIYDLFEIKE